MAAHSTVHSYILHIYLSIYTHYTHQTVCVHETYTLTARQTSLYCSCLSTRIKKRTLLLLLLLLFLLIRCSVFRFETHTHTRMNTRTRCLCCCCCCHCCWFRDYCRDFFLVLPFFRRSSVSRSPALCGSQCVCAVCH